MLSVCPKCSAQIEHEDFLFEVRCEKCATRFNPFMQLEGAASGNVEPTAMTAGDAAGAAGAPASEPPLADLSGGLEMLPPDGGSAPEPAPAPAPDYSESLNAFQEIQSYGESLGAGGTPPPASATAKPAAATRAAPPPPVNVAPGSECPVTAGDALPGYAIQGIFLPVSAAGDVDAGAANPLGNAIASLWQQALGAGGNGIIGLRWQLTPDGGKVFVTGTPVACVKG